MSKFKIDTSKFIFNDEYVENDLDILENISIIRQEEVKEPEPEKEPEPDTDTEPEINNINLNDDDNNNSNPQQ